MVLSAAYSPTVSRSWRATALTEVREKFRAGMAPALSANQADLVGQLLGLDFSTSLAVQAQLGSDSFGEMATAQLVKYIQTKASDPMVIFLEDIHWADDSSLDSAQLPGDRASRGAAADCLPGAPAPV